MAIALDATAESTFGASPNTWSHTCTGSDLILFVNAITDNDSITGITYNGVAMTLIAKGTYNAATRKTPSLWYLVNPATGANNVTITTTGESAAGESVSYTGASQTGVPDSSNTAVDDTATASFTISTTVVASDCWLVAAFCDDQGSGETGGTGTTVRQLGPQGQVLADSNGTVATGSQSLIINYSPNAKKSGVIASFKPPSTTAIKTINGLAIASVKSVNGLAIASVKSVNGLQ